MCSHLLQLSHWIIGLPSSMPLHTHRVLSLEMLLRPVDGVAMPSVRGEAWKEFEKGSYWP